MISFAAGCGGDDDDDKPTIDGGGLDGGHGDGGHGGNDGSAGDAGTSDVASKAADLRTELNLALSEHLVLAAKATGAALGGAPRKAEYDAYIAALNANGVELGDRIGAAYGETGKASFNAIWSAHNGYFVEYTVGVATEDTAKQTQAVNDLTTKYVPQFAKLLATATGLPESTLTELTSKHVADTKAIVDAQAAENWSTAYAKIREAFAHMSMIGSPLADATAKRLPQVLPGDALSKASTFRTQLNQGLQEHLFLASFATGAALGGRTAETTAAIAALNTNGTDLGTAITGLFGAQAGSTFNAIWSAHNGYFVEYTTGVATKDQAKIDKAVADLTTDYVPKFTALLVTATGLPTADVTKLVTDHVLKTKAIVDLQAANPANWPGVVAADRAGAHHMRELGDPLAKAIVARAPGSF